MAKFEEIISQAKTLESGTSASTRMQDFADTEKIFFLKDEGLPDNAWIKETIDPAPRNQVLTGARMMAANDPTWAIGYDRSDASNQETADRLEKLAGKCWSGSGVVRGKPVHFTAGLSALLYGEVHILVSSVADRIAAATPQRRARLERIQRVTPLMFDVLYPGSCYVLQDDLGLAAHVSKRKVTVGSALALGGKKAEQQLDGRRMTEEIILYEYWDLEAHAVWIDGSGDPLLLADHGLPMIPVIYRNVEGSELFTGVSTADPVQGFLYGVQHSGFWARQNLAYTVMFSNLFAIGANPQFLFKLAIDREMRPDWSVPGGGWYMQPGESVEQVRTQIFTPDLVQAVQMSDRVMEQSTMYRQIAGESMGSGTPYSTVSLLSQAGRQAMIPYTRAVESAVSEAMQVGFVLLRAAGGQIKFPSDASLTMSAKEVPDDAPITATLELQLPQDDRMNVQLAQWATQGQNPLLSMARAREKFLGEGQSADLQKEIWAEKQAEMKLQMRFQQQMAEEQMRLQQMQAAQIQQAQPPQGVPQQAPPQQPPQGPPGGGEQIPPELAQMMQQAAQQQTAQPGLPMAAPAPGPEEMFQ